MLYHATRHRFIGSIRREGLHPKARKSYQSQTNDNLVYFTKNNADCAASYAECADNIPNSWYDDRIIVLAVEEQELNKSYFCKDPNIEDDKDESTIAYKMGISPDKIGIIDFVNNKIEPLTKIKRLDHRFYYE